MLLRGGAGEGVGCLTLRPSVRVLNQSAQRVHKLHLTNRVAACFKKPRRANQKGQALRSRDGYVQAVAREEEGKIARNVLTARGRHGKEDYRGLLSLEFVNGADAHTRWQACS